MAQNIWRNRGNGTRNYDANKYGVGKPQYPSGAGPNTGKILDRRGYQKRDRQRAAQAKMRAAQKGNYFSAAWLKPPYHKAPGN